MEDTFWANMTINMASVALAGLFILLGVGLILRHWDKIKMRETSAQRRVKRELRLLPLKLNALERLNVMLERLMPGALVVRTNRGAMTGAQLQFELLKAVREEWEMNLAMHLYVSPQLREALAEAKREIDILLHKSAEVLPATASAMDLSRVVLENEERTGMKALRNALQLLRNEAASIIQL